MSTRAKGLKRKIVTAVRWEHEPEYPHSWKLIVRDRVAATVHPPGFRDEAEYQTGPYQVFVMYDPSGGPLIDTYPRTPAGLLKAKKRAIAESTRVVAAVLRDLGRLAP